MTSENKHINFFNQLENPFENKENELWDKIDEKTSIVHKSANKQFNLFRYSIAAVLLVFIISGVFIKFYTKTINSKNAEHITALLPDGSRVLLNAKTSISYKPYWWGFNRELTLNGEAFFEVEKGKQFKVISKKGITTVLGTSFNIFARDNTYKVFCKTGKVSVLNTATNNKISLLPNQIIDINKDIKVKPAKSEKVLGWKENKFIFEAEQLPYVIKEIERQYDIKVETDISNPSEYIYSGNFTKDKNAEFILNLICQSFGFTFVKVSDGNYKLKNI